MQLRYSITDDDSKRFIKCNFQNQNKKYKIFSYFILLVAVLFFIATLIAKDFTNAIVFLVLIIVLYFAYFQSPKITRKRHLKKLKDSGFLNEERIVTLEDKQISLHSESRKLSHEYSNIEKISVLDGYFVIVGFKYEDSFIIPSSAFENENQKIAFINTIKLKSGIL